jgi:hypothetical protein
MFLPCAARKVLAIAPPMQSASHLAEQRLDDVDLVAHLGAAEHATKGFSGLSTSLPSAASSFSSSKPAAAGRARAWAARAPRRARGAPRRRRRRRTRRRARRAGARRPRRWPLSSSWKRRFSSRQTCPARRSWMTFFGASPTQSSGRWTSSRVSSASRSPHTSRLRPSGLPGFGRPRCDARITLAPARSRADGRQRLADARVVGDRRLLVEGDVEVDADEDLLVLDGEVARRRCRRADSSVVGRGDEILRWSTSAQPFFAAMRARSIMRFEKPHSLSYQAKILAKLSPRPGSSSRRTMLEAGLPM